MTTGDPAGIGPEVSLRALQDKDLTSRCGFVLYGDAGILGETAASLRLPFDYPVISPAELLGLDEQTSHCVVHLDADRDRIVTGEGSAASGAAAARNIEACARACMGGALSAMVTAPLNKKWLREAGYPYAGHTEYLAHLAGVTSVAMAFLTERLKVVLVTVHRPLRLAIEEITPQRLLRKIELTVREFPRLGLSCRRLAVAGLNPHAGEEGLLGEEESEVIRPAIEEARQLFPEVAIEGPIPADTVFYRATAGEFDVVMALFHDQGLAPVKLIGFGEAVNLTLGLPFIRTSVDHGTAFDIAGQGKADPGSLLAAVDLAAALALR